MTSMLLTPQEAYIVQITAVLTKTREAALKLLTDEQQKKWKKAKGETFELPRRRRKKQE